MTISTFDAIVHRHQPDPAELNRVCRCGHPWPCDVRILADAIRRPTETRHGARLRGSAVTVRGVGARA